MTTTDAPAGPWIVGLACSAGGLAAVEKILARLPASFPAAVVVARHQSPGIASSFSTLLQRSSSLPVVDAEDGVRLSAGTVYVIPPGVHLLVRSTGRALLIPTDGPVPCRPSADLLFTSMALACGDRAVAVVLSGGGSDGATGAAAVHAAGGTVIASDEDTSEIFAMPAATIAREGVVDVVCPVREIAPVLVSVVAGDGRQAASC